MIENVGAIVSSGAEAVVRDAATGREYRCRVGLAPRQREILAAGGLLNCTRQNAGRSAG